ncbi:MAG: N-formylglutamate amidohydrolase [Sphingobium sp.]
MADPEEGNAFLSYGREIPASPVVLSVPHAGRTYPDAMWAVSRLSRAQMQSLEDRYADVLIAPLLAAGHSALVAQAPRALIDLNRDARDIDARLVRGIPHGQPLIESAKQRGGLGLFPRILPRVGELWRAPMTWREADKRIETIHRPYHAALARLLADAKRAHGYAILLDIHSMPPLVRPEKQARIQPEVVIGDRFGASAADRLSAAVQAVVSGQGYEVALNHPYSGSYILDRHGQPQRGIHAVQLEISRTLYLDPTLSEPGPGLADAQALIAQIVAAMTQELQGDIWPAAAE